MIYIFDLDGTLIDSIDLHTEAFSQAFQEFGETISVEDIRNLMGVSGKDIVRQLASGNHEKIYKRKVQISIEMVDKVREMEGATRVIQKLKNKGHKVCIATAANRKMTEAVIKKFGWKLDKVVTANDVENSKPAPDTLEAIVSCFEGDALFIGDSRFDREMGEKCGIRTVLLGEDIENLEDVLKL